MCGISGIINIKGFELSHLKEMTDIIKHRGPDDEGFMALTTKDEAQLCFGGNSSPKSAFLSDFHYKPVNKIDKYKTMKAQLGFGHRRLAILDLSPAGHQPMCFGKGKYWIVLNGEIYNYLEIKDELITFGYEFVSNSDTEVVLAAYDKWGMECQNRFNGMWAFVIFDSENKEIFMSRDRFGIKPLYYWFSPEGNFCFASEIKQFTVLPNWVAKLNRQRAWDYLIYSFSDHTEETMFDGVNQLPGGYCFKAGIGSIIPDNKGKINIVKWYEVPKYSYHGTFDQAAQQFKELFRNAIDLHLRADVPVGSALSGGLDSSAIVCEVNNILRELKVENLQKTFSSCSIDKRFDEKKWMDIVIKQTSVDAHFIYPKLEDVFNKTSELIWYHDEPYQSQSPFLGFHVFELAKTNNVKVLLNGQGADEYLGGYGQLTSVRFTNMFKKIEWVKLVREIHNSKNFTKYTYLFVLNSTISNILPRSIKNFLKKHLKIGLHQEIKNIINNNILGARDIAPYGHISANFKTIPEVIKYLTFYSTLPKYLKWEDRNSMAHSVEARVPFLDYRLFEFVINLPASYIDYQGETKRILRQGLKDILPEEIKNRKDKKGFITPEEMWVKEDDPILFRNKIKEAISISEGIIKPESLVYFDQIATGKRPFDYTYWRLILFGEWVKKFNVKLN